MLQIVPGEFESTMQKLEPTKLFQFILLTELNRPVETSFHSSLSSLLVILSFSEYQTPPKSFYIVVDGSIPGQSQPHQCQQFLLQRLSQLSW